MCVIVHQPTGQHLDKDTASRLWGTNPDGGGFAFVDDNATLQVVKTMQFGQFWREFETARSSHRGRDFLLHMRIATHGSVDINNVHPFQVDEHTVMAHNGIIHGVADKLSKKDARSDTLYFVEEVLPRLPETWLDDEYLSDMVTEWIGWSKLMFLTTNPKLNRQVYRLGDWKEWNGLPMSNTNGLSVVKKAVTYTERFSETRSYPGLPKPDTTEEPARNSYYETSSEWEDWLAYKQMSFGDEPVETLDDGELDILLEAIKEERKGMYVNHPIVVIDGEKPLIECGQCMAEIDLNTAECMCWDSVCQQCWQFMALCRSAGPCSQAGMIEFDSLTDRGKEFVHDGGMEQFNTSEDDRKIMEKALSKGA